MTMLAELLRLVEPRLHVDGILERRIRRRGRHADLAGGDILVLLLDGEDDILRLETIGLQLVRIHPDAHRIGAGAEHLDAADAGQARQSVDQVDRRVIAQEKAVIFAFGRFQRDDLQNRGVFLLDADALRLNRLGQRSQRQLHAVLHEHLRNVRIGADFESDGQVIGAVRRAGRLHVEHVVDAIDLGLDRQGDGIDDGLRAGAGIARRDLHGRRHDIGIFRNGKTVQAIPRQ